MLPSEINTVGLFGFMNHKICIIYCCSGTSVSLSSNSRLKSLGKRKAWEKMVRMTESRNKEPKDLAESQEVVQNLVHFSKEHVLTKKTKHDFFLFIGELPN